MLITGTVGLSGVPTAFSVLGRPDDHAKIVIDPRRAEAALRGAWIVGGGSGPGA
ncbi:hypothetical protein [Catellatospora vulcania]|uniref:hypothetical protein n=1 Tax=Catellatospora vulcania TaxID=1460450 RepID=UPI0018AFA9F9|nr:hypothetical protein [Catellatospora vulcania]